MIDRATIPGAFAGSLIATVGPAHADTALCSGAACSGVRTSAGHADERVSTASADPYAEELVEAVPGSRRSF